MIFEFDRLASEVEFGDAMGKCHRRVEETGILDRQAGHEYDLLHARQHKRNQDQVSLYESGRLDHRIHIRISIAGHDQHRKSVVRNVLLDRGGDGAGDLHEGQEGRIGLGYVQKGEGQGGWAIGGAGEAGTLVGVVESGTGVEKGPLEQHEPVAA